MTDIAELVQKLRIMSAMLINGDLINFGTDATIMHESADTIERLAGALDAAHYYIDASNQELFDAGITREDALGKARELRTALSGKDTP